MLMKTLTNKQKDNIIIIRELKQNLSNKNKLILKEMYYYVSIKTRFRRNSF